jgi:hypothetical protein
MGKASGPCAQQAYAAYEQDPSNSSAATFIINNFGDLLLQAGAAGGHVGRLFQCAVTPYASGGCYEFCFSADAGPVDAAPGGAMADSPSCLP